MLTAESKIKYLEDQLQRERLERHLLDTTVKCAMRVIEEHDGSVLLSKFSKALYEADKGAKPAFKGTGRRMLEWLRTMEHIFELHGEGQNLQHYVFQNTFNFYGSAGRRAAGTA